MMTIMFASLTLVYLFWETARVAVLQAPSHHDVEARGLGDDRQVAGHARPMAVPNS